MRGGERGVSEVVGFVLVFAVVFAGVGVIQTAGFETVADVRDRERAASAERAFMTLAGNVDDVRHGAPGRSTSLRLGPGRLQVVAGPTVTVVEDGTRRSFATGGLSYRVDSASTTYASGGVFAGDADGSVVHREPALACRPGSTDASIVSVVTFRPAAAGVDTDGPVSVVTRENGTSASSVDEVVLNVSGTPHADAWGRSLARAGWNETGPSTYSCAANRSRVHRTTVDVRFVA